MSDIYDIDKSDADLRESVRKILDRSYPDGYEDEMFDKTLDWFWEAEINISIVHMAEEGLVDIFWKDDDIWVKLHKESTDD